MAQQNIIDVITTAKRLIRETGSPVPWEIVAAQWALESGFGRHAPGGNPFGHKASSTSSAKLLKTTEVFTLLEAEEFLEGRGRTLKPIRDAGGGKTEYEAQDWFVDYDGSLDAAVRGHLRILSLPRYSKALKGWPTHGDVGRLAVEIAAAGYATTAAKEYGARVARCFRDSRMAMALRAMLAAAASRTVDAE